MRTEKAGKKSNSVRKRTSTDKFRDFVKFHGKDQLVKSIRSVHDAMIYGSRKRISRKKRDELHDLNLLADKISQLEV